MIGCMPVSRQAMPAYGRDELDVLQQKLCLQYEPLVAKEIGRNRGILHQNHGLLTASQHSIDDAAFWFIALERACKQQMLVEATGIKPQLLSPKTAQYSREHVGSDYIGWLHFQTLYSHIAATQPDMFE